MAKSKGELSDLVQLLVKKGQLKKALEAMHELYALDKKDPLVTLRMGDLCLKMGDKDGAAENYVRTAGLFAEKGHTPKAIATYKMVLRVDPSLTGVQDKIDELTGEADKPRPAFDKKNIKVDLAKEIPGLEEAAMGFPEPAPIKEPDDTPVYEIDTPIPIGSGIIKKYDQKKPEPPAEPAFEMTGSGDYELDTGRADSGPAPAFDVSDMGSDLEFDDGRAGSAPSFDITDTGNIELDSGTADTGGYELETGGSSSSFEISAPDEDFGSGSIEGGAAAVFEKFGDGALEFDNGRADGGQAFGNDAWAPEALSSEGGSPLDFDSTDISSPGMTFEPAITGMGDVTGEQALDALDALEVLDDMLVEESHAEAVPDKSEHGGAGIALFSDFTQDELWDLFGKMKRLSFKKDEKIVHEGDSGRSLFIIKAGSVRVVTKTGSADLFLATLGEREFFGEVSFLTGKPRTADVIANGPTEIMEFKREDLDEQIKKHPNLEKVLKTFYEARVADTLETLKAMPRDLNR
ncbi:MAG: cyclic nucleotide-binding domain-containing protein [Nitrospirae bacterium]|nr:cyclic nucleotide-binding domain-containing protein [Nitrospirota bacterium]